jgi:hypothetical protein
MEAWLPGNLDALGIIKCPFANQIIRDAPGGIILREKFPDWPITAGRPRGDKTAEDWQQVTGKKRKKNGQD